MEIKRALAGRAAADSRQACGGIMTMLASPSTQRAEWYKFNIFTDQEGIGIRHFQAAAVLDCLQALRGWIRTQAYERVDTQNLRCRVHLDP